MLFGMPRAARVNVGGIAYHVLNRANARLALFECDADYELRVRVLPEAPQRVVAEWHLESTLPPARPPKEETRKRFLTPFIAGI